MTSARPFIIALKNMFGHNEPLLNNFGNLQEFDLKIKIALHLPVCVYFSDKDRHKGVLPAP